MRGGLCIFLLITPMLVCCILDIDAWPFSNFPMYSQPMRLGEFTQHGIFRVHSDGSSEEIRTTRLLWPLNYSRLLLQARDTEQMRVRLKDYARRWQLQPGERLELRRLRVNFRRDGNQLRSEVLKSEVELREPPQ